MRARRRTRKLAKVDADGLTPREAKFVHEYLRDFNARRAMLRVVPRYGEGTAGVEGCRLLKKPNVARAVERRKEEARAALKMEREEIMVRLAAVARSNVAAVETWKGNTLVLRDAAELTELEAYTVESVKAIPGRTTYGKDGEVLCEESTRLAFLKDQVWCE
jgi:phage terminase small subunit